MRQLNRTTAQRPAVYPLRILQFGGGNFLRAFTDWMIDILNEQTSFRAAVAIVKPTEAGDYTELRMQEGLFHVDLTGIRAGQLIQEHRLISCVQAIIHPYDAYEAYLATARQAEMRFIFSNTTEAGIVFEEVPFPDSHCPQNFPAKLSAWLYQRYKHFKGHPDRGCILLPLELIEQNGAALKSCVLQYAAHWQLETAFSTWITQHNVFCNSLVDRIVSGYPSEQADAIQQELGFVDPLLVAGEYYHSWVIEASHDIRHELPFHQTDLHVHFVEDLTAYREIKVRILNGAHTAMVPVGYLSNIQTVREAMEHPKLGTFVEKLLQTEVMPSLDFSEQEVQAYIRDVLDRFRNPAIQHRLLSISLNAVSKFRTRLLPSLLAYEQTYKKLPKHIVFAFASLIRFYQGQWKGQSIPLQDEASVLAFFEQSWAACDESPDSLLVLCKQVLGQKSFWNTDLNEVAGLAKALADHLYRDVRVEGIQNIPN